MQRQSRGDTVVGVTVSIGISGSVAGPVLEDLVASADRAMYAVKAGGRNQVRVDVLDSPPSVSGGPP